MPYFFSYNPESVTHSVFRENGIYQIYVRLGVMNYCVAIYCVIITTESNNNGI